MSPILRFGRHLDLTAEPAGLSGEPGTECSAEFRGGAVDDRGDVQAWREGAVGAAPVAAQAGGAEGVGNSRVTVPDQQRCLQDEGQALGHAAGAVLDCRGVGEAFLDVLDGCVQALVGSLGEGYFFEERL
jgi:hypothetical protein